MPKPGLVPVETLMNGGDARATYMPYAGSLQVNGGNSPVKHSHAGAYLQPLLTLVQGYRPFKLVLLHRRS